MVPPRSPNSLREEVALKLPQGGEELLLATADARNNGDDLGRISWTVTIPMIHLRAAITSLAVAAVPSIGRIWLMKNW